MMERAAVALLCALAFTLPWEKSVVIPWLGTATKLVGALTLTATLLTRNFRPSNLPLVLATLFAAWSATTWFWSLDSAATASRAATYVQLLAMMWIAWQVCRTEERQRLVLQAYVAGAAVASLTAIFRYSQNLQTYYRRYAAAGFDPNDFAFTVAFAIPIALYLARSKPWVYRAAAVLFCAAILLTASRTALVATYIALAIMLLWRSERWTAAALAILFTAGALWLAPRESRQRLATIGTEVQKGSTLHNRTRIWKTGLKALKQAPVRGAGSGAFPQAVKPWLGVPPVPGHEYVAHNVFLSVLVETGLIGFALYALLLSALIVFVLVLRSPERLLWLSVAAMWLLAASTLTWEHRKPWWLFAGLIAAQWARAYREEQRVA